MSAPDQYEDPEGIALVEGILERVGYRGHLGPVDQVAEDIATAASKLVEAFPWTSFEGAAETLAKITNTLEPVKPTARAIRRDKRAAALAAKAAKGKGPPSSSCWRGRERTTKYRSQS